MDLRIHQRFHRARWDTAVVVVRAIEADDNVAFRLIKTDAPNKTAAGHISEGPLSWTAVRRHEPICDLIQNN
jgi:hypothetical protein